jgi:N-methylhydantoinase B/oxoprolinase/acetone carboxylase alpha subunit
VISVNDVPIAPTSAPDVHFKLGDIVRFKTPGGAGHGSPRNRAPASVESDLRDGYITKLPPGAGPGSG